MTSAERAVSAHIVGLDEMLAALKAAHASVGDMKDANREIAALLVPPSQREAPVRSGRLRGSIGAAATTRAAVLEAGVGDVAYAGPIHFGWPTRGLGAGRSKESLIGALGSAGNRSVSDKTLRKTARQSSRSRGRVRGGPIRPNPFLYRAIDARIGDIEDAYERRVDAISAAVESGLI